MVYGVGSKDYFEKRQQEIFAVEAIGIQGAKIADKLANNDLSCKGLFVLIGKAFRELVEFFSEGYYKKKLDKRIKVLKDPKFDNYEKRIDDFYSRFIKKLRTRAFEGFKADLDTFYQAANSLVSDLQVKQVYPELHEQLKLACGGRKTVACEALSTLGDLLASTVVNPPATQSEQLILQLKEEFAKGAPIESYLEENLTEIQKGLRLRKYSENALRLCRFLDLKNAYLASLVPSMEVWKSQMLKQRENFLNALPMTSDDLTYYSFCSEQIKRVKRILKLQKEEVRTDSRLEIVLANFIADNLLEKIREDKRVIKVSKKGLFDKFEKQKNALIAAKEKAERKLKHTGEAEQTSETQERIDQIEVAQKVNEECLTILKGCYQVWVLPIQNDIQAEGKELKQLTLKKANLNKYAKMHYTICLFRDKAQDSIDAMLAESAYRILRKEVSKTDPQGIPEGATEAEIKTAIRRTYRFIHAIEELNKEHFKPLETKMSGQGHDPHWVERVQQLLNEIKPELKKLSDNYNEIVQNSDPNFKRALQVSQKIDEP